MLCKKINKKIMRGELSSSGEHLVGVHKRARVTHNVPSSQREKLPMALCRRYHCMSVLY